MNPRAHSILDLLAYRLSAIDAMAFACRLKSQWTAPVPIQILFDGKLSIQGLSTAYTNPVFEAGIVHCRVLLEFLGLQVDRDDCRRLKQRSTSRADDDLIESFTAPKGPLPLVTPTEATVGYTGQPEEAERALAYVIHVANKGVAHSTAGLAIDPEDDRLIELAVKGIRILFNRHFYRPLGLEPPASHVNILSGGESIGAAS